ncbi:aminotransferase [Capsulimonas corticalis]|uniref:Aminotransferase n=1 Tax=Capsulimonas corticalis TaxID=2219043 RepID=A0A402D0W8_9BACT|nr:pyridoxal phosphate-dependent aminotransferase [Capsulimonas corticalis]BDI31753.1 aminotransferase [Capsulimonas corticalis]
MLSQRARNAAPSPTLAITAKANALKASGVDVVGFGAGEPDFDTPAHVKDAAIAALAAGDTKYTASSGTVALKDAIIAKLKRDNNLTYGRNEILVSVGAKHSIYNLMQAMLDPGDEVIIPTPYWVSYPEQVKLADGVPVFIKTDESTGFLATAAQVEEKLTDKTKIVIINSPSNPTGAVYTPQALREISDLCVSRGVYLMSDEIYEKIIYPGNTFVSPASFSDQARALTITINGFSKAHSMTGWRLGYTAADPEIIAAMSRIQDQSTSNPVSFAQAGAVEALNASQDSVETMRVAFEERRNYIVAALNDIPGFQCLNPGGAFYVFPNVSALYGKSWKTESGDLKQINSSDDFAEYLLTAKGVAVVPGSGFGADGNVRLSYATSMKNIEKGVARIAEAVGQLQ